MRHAEDWGRVPQGFGCNGQAPAAVGFLQNQEAQQEEPAAVKLGHACLWAWRSLLVFWDDDDGGQPDRCLGILVWLHWGGLWGVLVQQQEEI